jgi:hypothetical protein
LKPCGIRTDCAGKCPSQHAPECSEAIPTDESQSWTQLNMSMIALELMDWKRAHVTRWAYTLATSMPERMMCTAHGVWRATWTWMYPETSSLHTLFLNEETFHSRSCREYNP